jgi:hypothetical protein
LEFQLLTARLLEVQAHLPHKHQNPGIDGLQTDNNIADSIASDWDTEQEIDDSSNLANDGYDNDDSDDGNLSDQDDDLTSTKCPHSRCRHKGRFLRAPRRLRHEWTSVDQWAGTGGSKRGWPWALVHVTPRPTTVSERLKTASKAAVSGLPFTVSSLIVVLISFLTFF